MRLASGIPLLSTRKALSGQKNKPAQPFLCGLASLREFLFRLWGFVPEALCPSTFGPSEAAFHRVLD